MLLNYRMRFYLILFFCFSVFFIGCTEDKRKIPAGIIPEHDMAELITDIHIVDGSLYNIPQVPDSMAKHGLGLYLAVFKVHNTDSAEFKKSLKFYSTRPDILSEIYAGVNNRLDKKLDSLKKIKPKINQDSVKKAVLKHKADSLQKAKANIDSLQKIKVKAKADSLKKADLKKKRHSSKKNKHKNKNALSK